MSGTLSPAPNHPQMFNTLETPDWGLLFCIAPRDRTIHDGETIVTAITKAT